MPTNESLERDKQILVEPNLHRRVMHADSMYKKLVTSVLPHVPVPSVSMRIISLVHIAIAIAFWMAIPESTFPGPVKIVQAFGRLWVEAALGRELLTSLLLNLHMIALLIPIGVATVIARSMAVTKGLVTVSGTFRFLGLTGLTLIFTSYTSGAHSLKLSILVFAVGAYYVSSVARIVDNEGLIPKRDYVRTLGMSEWQAMYEIDLRGCAVELYEALRLNQAMGWMMLTAVEGIAKSEGGVGTLLLQSQRTWSLDEVYAIQLTLWLLGLGLDWLFVQGRIMIPWSDLKQKTKGGK